MKVTTKMIDSFIKLYTTDNLSLREISNRYNVSKNTVRYYLIQRGQKMKTKKDKRGRIKEFYKNKYCIALYDLNDNLYKVFDNCADMANCLGKSLNTLYTQLNEKRIHKKLRYKGNWYRKVLIEV